jgi:hypothetical protein
MEQRDHERKMAQEEKQREMKMISEHKRLIKEAKLKGAKTREM